MKALTKSLVALSLATALVASSAYAADDGQCSLNAGKISVQGTGEVKVMPDMAKLSYSVTSTESTPDAARQAVEKTVTAFTKEITALKIADTDYTAANLTLYPKYTYDEKTRKQKLTGYTATRDVSINIKDFSLISKLNDAALKSGINQVAGFTYSVSEIGKYEQEATKKAIEDAKTRANALAEGFEVKLGAPCKLSYGQETASVPYAPAARALSLSAADSAPTQSTYNVEPITIKSTVSASYSIGQ